MVPWTWPSNVGGRFSLCWASDALAREKDRLGGGSGAIRSAMEPACKSRCYVLCGDNIR